MVTPYGLHIGTRRILHPSLLSPSSIVRFVSKVRLSADPWGRDRYRQII